MKVLFAVNNEDVSESIIKLYQKEYKEIISGKNVYYFNAIIKELQRDQTYDRIVISEDLEPYTNNNFDIIDKFLFEQLDKISDEAISDSGTDIPIIFIATDRRSKSDDLLSKLFSIGIYDALLGQDRSIPEVCKLLNKPRTKKEAKAYYRIETEEVSYQVESEDSVSETEIQNILTHYKKLGKNTDRYVDSFNNIAAQYTDSQLRVISKFLPINVRAVLESESTKYQSIMTFGEDTYRRQVKVQEEKPRDLKIGFIETNNEKGRPTKPVVIPSAVNTEAVKKLTKKPEPEVEEVTSLSIEELINDEETKEASNSNTELDDMFLEENDAPNLVEETMENKTEQEAEVEPKTELEAQEPVKRKRGRPRKVVDPNAEPIIKEPKKRGRPRKVVAPVEGETILPGFETNEMEKNILPGFEEAVEEPLNLFGLAEEAKNKEAERIIPDNREERRIENTRPVGERADLTRLLTKDKKIVAFVGTPKAGTSFLINNLADMLSKTGIKTAIVDLTENRNSYYIYTKNEEPLRRVASNCLEKIENRNSRRNRCKQEFNSIYFNSKSKSRSKRY